MITIGSGTDSASAASGRRLCVYAQDEGGWIEARENRNYHAWVAVNSPKEGDCVTVDPAKFQWKVGAQPVQKITCEEWPAKVNPWPGQDICDNMVPDAVYEFRVFDDGNGIGIARGADIHSFQ
jgi:hypothetical protein